MINGNDNDDDHNDDDDDDDDCYCYQHARMPSVWKVVQSLTGKLAPQLKGIQALPPFMADYTLKLTEA